MRETAKLEKVRCSDMVLNKLALAWRCVVHVLGVYKRDCKAVAAEKVKY